jgi:hypothetical protein
VAVFPFAFHIAVQQPFRPLWSLLLLHDHEPSRASFALCFKSLLMSLLPASGEFLLDFPSPRHLSSSGSYPFDLSGLGDPTGSITTAGLSLRVTGTHKPLYHGNVKIPTEGVYIYTWHCFCAAVLFTFVQIARPNEIPVISLCAHMSIFNSWADHCPIRLKHSEPRILFVYHKICFTYMDHRYCIACVFPLKLLGHLGTVKGYRVAVRIELRIALLRGFFLWFTCVCLIICLRSFNFHIVVLRCVPVNNIET